jgi:hypothetical protein
MDTTELRRVREYVAWLLLVAALVIVVVGLWQFLNLPGSPGRATFGSAGLSFAERGEEAVGTLASITLTIIVVAAVLLAALAGRPVPSARRVVLTAVVIQAVALALALIGWGAALPSSGGWFPLTGAVNLVVAGAGLILSVTVLRAPALGKAG